MERRVTCQAGRKAGASFHGAIEVNGLWLMSVSGAPDINVWDICDPNSMSIKCDSFIQDCSGKLQVICEIELKVNRFISNLCCDQLIIKTSLRLSKMFWMNFFVMMSIRVRAVAKSTLDQCVFNNKRCPWVAAYDYVIVQVAVRLTYLPSASLLYILLKCMTGSQKYNDVAIKILTVKNNHKCLVLKQSNCGLEMTWSLTVANISGLMQWGHQIVMYQWLWTHH